MSSHITDSMEFAATTARAQNRPTPNHLLVTQLLLRHNVALVYNIALINAQGKLASYALFPMLKSDPYATGANSARTVWVGVSRNRQATTNNKQETVYRNTAAGMVELFLTPSIDTFSNPYNAAMIQDAELRDVYIPSDLTSPNNEQLNKAFDALMSKCAEIEKTIPDETIANAEIKKVYASYQAWKLKQVEEKVLTKSQILLTPQFLPCAALTQFLNGRNPFLNWPAITQKFSVTHAPVINTVSGFITTSNDAAPEGSDLVLGRRVVDAGKNARHETSVMANVADQFGDTTSVLARVIDPAYTARDPNSLTRSEVFEEVASKPTAMFVHGSLSAFVAETGTKGVLNGNVQFSVLINNYTQHQQVLNPTMSANSLAALDNEDNFNNCVLADWSQDLQSQQITATPVIASQDTPVIAESTVDQMV